MQSWFMTVPTREILHILFDSEPLHTPPNKNNYTGLKANNSVTTNIISHVKVKLTGMHQRVLM